MESVLEGHIHSLLNTVTNQVFKGTEALFDNQDRLNQYSDIFAWSQLFIWLSIGVIFLFTIKRAIYFGRESGKGVLSYLKENRRYYSQIFVLFLISLFPNAILYFTYDVFGSLVQEESAFQLAKDVTGNIEGGVISVAVIKLTTVGALLFISLVQVIEMISLILVLSLSPLVLFSSLFNRTLFNQFIRVFIQGILSPVTQALLLLFLFQYFLPVLLQNVDTPMIFQSVILLLALWFSYSGAGLFTKHLFLPSEKIPLSIRE